jgi:hypothetical protein
LIVIVPDCLSLRVNGRIRAVVTGPGYFDDFKAGLKRAIVLDSESETRIGNNQPIIIRDGIGRAAPPVSNVFEVEFYGDVPIRGFEHIFYPDGAKVTEAGKSEKGAYEISA